MSRPLGETTSYLLTGVPALFWQRVRGVAREEGLTMRDLILRLLREWLEQKESGNAGSRNT